MSMQDARFRQLIALAGSHLERELSDVELEILRASTSPEDPDWTKPEKSAKLPEVPAELIRWLVTDPETERLIAPWGVRVPPATITGSLDLRECRAHSILVFYRCRFQETINLQSAKTQSILFPHSKLEKGLLADRITVHGFLFLGKVKSFGEIRLAGARIKGDLDFNNADLKCPDSNNTNGKSTTVRADQQFTKGSLKESLRIAYECSTTFVSHGTVNLIGAQIAGGLMFTGTTIEGMVSNPAEGSARKIAVIAVGAKIDGTVFFNRDFSCSGEIMLISARIGRYVSFVSAKVGRVNCANIQISGDFHWRGITAIDGQQTTLNLTGAKLRKLRDDKESWPQKEGLIIGGLDYEDISLHQKLNTNGDPNADELLLVAQERIEWLERQPDEKLVESQPWMHLRNLLEKKGDDRGAKLTLRKLRCYQARKRLYSQQSGKETANPGTEQDRQEKKCWLARACLRVGVSVISGFLHYYYWLQEQPLRVLLSLSLAVLVGSLVFGCAYHVTRPTEGADFYAQEHPDTLRDEKGPAIIETVRLLPAASAEKWHFPNGYPSFNPFIYALENALPLVKLGMDDRWVPNAHHDLAHASALFPGHPRLNWLRFMNCYGFLASVRWLLILSGWVQASILVVAVSSQFKE